MKSFKLFLSVSVLVFLLLVDDIESLRFANHYADRMVLQREPYAAVLWGFGESGTDVTVSVIDMTSKHRTSYASQVEVDSRGLSLWRVVLSPYKAGGPYEITLQGKNGPKTFSSSLTDVLFGDVWICSGQSNMRFTTLMSITGEEEVNQASNYKNVRLFTLGLSYSSVPIPELSEDNIQQNWSVASKNSVGGPAWQYFSAVCWMFGRRLYDKLQIPIGLITTAYGGTRVEAWSSPETLSYCKNTRFKGKSEIVHNPQNNLSALYNAMIYPLLNVTIYGTVWYQGEHNAIKEDDPYNCTFPALINGWRKEWYEATHKNTNPEFPFGFVQLAPLALKDERTRPHFSSIRWKQTASYGYVPNPKQTNTFMAVAIDLPDDESPYGSIHPRHKADVADRLLLGALDVAYHEKDVYWKGPIAQEVRVNELPEFKEIVRVTYNSSSLTENGIKVRSLIGFEVEFDSNGNWLSVYVHAYGFDFIELLIEKKGQNVVTGVRYAWSSEPCNFKECSVYDADTGLPSPPFIKFAPFVVTHQTR